MYTEIPQEPEGGFGTANTAGAISHSRSVGGGGHLSAREDDNGSFLASPACAERPNNETTPPGRVGDDRPGGVSLDYTRKAKPTPKTALMLSCSFGR